jgi:hypothetical protein
MMPWISVRNWRKFQHYDPEKRVPPWIKNNTDLMANDSYLSLSTHRALMLHRLWLEYASSRCELSDDTLRLSRRLCMKVTRGDIESLSEAGFITIVASKALAEGYHVASARAHAEETETDEETETEKGGSSKEETFGVNGHHSNIDEREPELPEPPPLDVDQLIRETTVKLGASFGKAGA